MTFSHVLIVLFQRAITCYTCFFKKELIIFLSRMASQSEGIQRLLEAEKEAQKDIDAARRRKLNFLIFVNFFSSKLRIKN